MVTILDLPDELLFSILRASTWPASDENSQPVPEKNTATALVLVCQCFYRLVTPILYRDIWIQCNPASSDQGASISRSKMLHRTFRSNSNLRQHCQRFEIVLGSPWPFSKSHDMRESPAQNPIYIIMDLLNWLTNTVELSIQCWPQDAGRWNQRSQGQFPTSADISVLMNVASQNLVHLKTIEAFGGHDATLSLPLIVTGLNDLRSGASLRTLDLSGVSQLGDAHDWEVLQNNAGTAPFTELKLRHFTQSSQALEALVMWPAKLEAFTFSMPRSDNYSGQSSLTAYTLGTMQTILSHQKAWLSHIKIHELLNQGLFDFNLSEFCQLHTLWLSHDLTGTDTVSVANLAAPNLEVFYWDMALEDQQCGAALDAFSQAEEDWLREFASSAIEHGSALKRIQINFCPEPWFRGETCENFEYPWDRMDRLAREIRPHGIALVYDTPNIARHEFLEKINGTSASESISRLAEHTFPQNSDN